MGDVVMLWTIQSWDDWRTLRDTGVLRRGDEHRAHVDPDFIEPYEWMRAQMRERIPGYAGAWPLWAWSRPRPNLWNESSGWPLGSPFVRIEFLAESARVLRSDFQAWHCILNQGPVCITEAEDAAWDARPGRYDTLPPDVQAEIRATWPRILDLDALAQSPYWYDGRRDQQEVQAVVEEIRREDVIRVTPCIGRQLPPRVFRHIAMAETT